MDISSRKIGSRDGKAVLKLRGTLCYEERQSVDRDDLRPYGHMDYSILDQADTRSGVDADAYVAALKEGLPDVIAFRDGEELTDYSRSADIFTVMRAEFTLEVETDGEEDASALWSDAAAEMVPGTEEKVYSVAVTGCSALTRETLGTDDIYRIG